MALLLLRYIKVGSLLRQGAAPVGALSKLAGKRRGRTQKREGGRCVVCSRMDDVMALVYARRRGGELGKGGGAEEGIVPGVS